ncbi:MAG TPA: apolipoprotein N-acyltransferase [Jatrophihabitans sp.]|jgi:apolipoprotein N-acyltransferase
MRWQWRVSVRERAATVSVRVAAPVAVAAGLVAAAAFPRLSIWPLAVVSVAGLSWAVDGRRARTGAWLGLLYGLAFFVPLLHWTGIYVGAAPWLILAGAEAGFMALLGAVLTVVQRLPGRAFWVACAWVLQEALRDRLPFGGFPWGRLAFSQQDSPLRWFIELGGAPLLSFAVAFTGAGLWLLVTTIRRSPDVRAVIVALALAVVLPAGGALWGLAVSAPSTANQLQVAVVQGSVPDRGLAFEDRARQVLDNHVTQTLRLAGQIRSGQVPQPDLVVWPENSSDVDPLVDASAAAEITRAVRAVHAPVLVGAILDGPGPDHRRNAGILWSPTHGPGAQYIKRHPVPFAEYIPLRSIAESVSSAAKLVTQDMVAGSGNGLLKGGPAPIGDVICFEVAYDDLVQSSVAAGAQLVVVQTNNATFGHTAETYQQLAMSRLRAIETGRTVLQASTTGVSAIIAPNGTVVRESGALFEPALLSASVPLETRTTPAVALGAVPEWTLAALAVLAVAAVVASGVATRQRRTQEVVAA